MDSIISLMLQAEAERILQKFSTYSNSSRVLYSFFIVAYFLPYVSASHRYKRAF